METIGVRELQQRASKALGRVEAGETIGVTVRGRLVAVLSPPPFATGAKALEAAGRVCLASRSASELPVPRAFELASDEVLAALRAER